MRLVKTAEELAGARVKKVAEFKALPDRSLFGDDNRATERLMLKIFDKLEKMEVGDDLGNTLSGLLDLSDTAEAMEYVTSESIGILEWAGGLAELDG